MTCQHCNKPVHCRGLCAAHYHAWRRSPEFQKKGKGAAICHPDRPMHAKGKCVQCYAVYARRKREGKCTICGQKVDAQGLCQMHYQRLRRSPEFVRVVLRRQTCALCDQPAHAKGLCNTHYAGLVRKSEVAPCSDGGHHVYSIRRTCVKCGAQQPARHAANHARRSAKVAP